MMCLSDDLKETEEPCSETRTVQDAILEAKNQGNVSGEDFYWLELDEIGIDDENLKFLELSANFPVSTLHTSSRC